jgi:hypothetical protein
MFVYLHKVSFCMLMLLCFIFLVVTVTDYCEFLILLAVIYFILHNHVL